MAFFRVKKIKGKEYAYIVENKWKRKGSRQKVKGYIGKVYRFDLLHDVDFLEYSKIGNVQDYIENSDKDKIINDLIEWELFKFGINKEDFTIDLSNIKIKKNKKNVALMINEGCMCNLTLKNLLEFKQEDEQTDGYRFARAFVEAGIKVPREIFVGICQKLFSF
ncbi:MAG: hypothetical protein Q8R04_03800 [Nanoarchaeota archaeon]|nr:hypothetical protein [Nanoarchaeota archaeon]